MWTRVKQIFSDVFPPCQNCDTSSADIFCSKCLEALAFKKICKTCGRFLNADGLEECVPCRGESKPWKSLHISFTYAGGVEKWLHDIKDAHRYERFRELKRKHLPLEFLELAKTADAFVPVSSDPLHTKQRQFDSALLLAERLQNLCGVFVEQGVFRRTPFLQSQRGLVEEMRKTFLRQTVSVSESAGRISGKRVILVDDVMTTGASIRVHAELLRNRAEEVHVFCLARTPKYV